MKNFRYEQHAGETGDQFEADFIGQIDTRNPKYKEAWNKAFLEELEDFKKGNWPKGKGPPTGGYLRFEKAMGLARGFQPYQGPFSPSNPDKPFGKDMRLETIKLFEKYVFQRSATPEERKRFQFFTGADKFKNEEGNINNSPIDRHGVDAWIEYTDENGRTYMATFDMTKRDKGNFSNRDIVVREKELHDPHLEPDNYEDAIERFGKQVIQKMLYREILEKKIVIDR